MKNYFKVGDVVVFTDKKAHKRAPRYYPAPGTVGKIVYAGYRGVMIQWPVGFTSMGDTWFASTSSIRLVENNGKIFKIEVENGLFGTYKHYYLFGKKIYTTLLWRNVFVKKYTLGKSMVLNSL